MPLLDFLSANSKTSGSSSIQDILQHRVERAFLQNLDTGQNETFLVNPSALKESYGASYKMHAAIGLSHQRMQFVGNPNATWPINVFFDQLVFDLRQARLGVNTKGSNVSHTSSPSDVEKWRRFLVSLLYRARGKEKRAPSPVLFHWPGMLSVRVRVLKVDFSHSLFQVGTTRTRAYTATITLMEDAEGEITSDDILEQGMHRSWATRGR